METGAPVPSESPPPQALNETASESSASVPSRFTSFLFMLSPKCSVTSAVFGGEPEDHQVVRHEHGRVRTHQRDGFAAPSRTRLLAASCADRASD